VAGSSPPTPVRPNRPAANQGLPKIQEPKKALTGEKRGRSSFFEKVFKNNDMPGNEDAVQKELRPLFSFFPLFFPTKPA